MYSNSLQLPLLLFLPLPVQATSSQALSASQSSTIAYGRNTRAHVLDINVGIAKGRADNVLRHLPEAVKDVEGTRVVRIKSAD